MGPWASKQFLTLLQVLINFEHPARFAFPSLSFFVCALPLGVVPGSVHSRHAVLRLHPGACLRSRPQYFDFRGVGLHELGLGRLFFSRFVGTPSFSSRSSFGRRLFACTRLFGFTPGSVHSRHAVMRPRPTIGCGARLRYLPAAEEGSWWSRARTVIIA